jgi:tetratricopeptide (TPR) repeat protein
MKMKILKASLLATMAPTAVAAVFLAASASAQSFKATVHGHVTNPLGQNFIGGDVKFTKDMTVPFKDEKFLNTVAIDADGNYKATDVAPGDYFVYVVQGEKLIDRQELTVKAGDDKTLDFDMTRAEYVKAMTPEEKKALEDYKKKNAEIVSANKVIEGLNATLKTVRSDLDAAAPTKGDVSKDVDLMKQAVGAKADVGLLWLTYGNTLLAQGDHLKAEDKKAGKDPLSDDAVLKEYSDAIDAYKKGQTLDAAEAKPNTAEEGSAYNQIGTTYGHENKLDDAAAAFESAAKIDPPQAGKYYKNEAIVLENGGQNDAAAVAADKSIAADPKQALPYYLKAQALVTKSTYDEKTKTLTAPPGCVEAYQTFLQLAAPNDPLVPEVKTVLASLGQKINTTYKAPK